MSQMLAPYNNSMRLGQGFNSYTQQICLDKAVLPASEAPKKTKDTIRLSAGTSGTSKVAAQDGSDTIKVIEQGKSDEVESYNREEPARPGIEIMPWVKPQIVTYSSRFVDKLSDVTDAMNISGSLSIKTATIGGKANGSYVDSDKFKASDINFHLQVKVTNQIHDAPEYSVFNKIPKVEKHEFPEVYGDSFISGWEEGGELNAIISIKVHDKAKVFEIKAGLEAEMSTPTISGKIKADVSIDKKNLNRETETTISVSWSGGGSIKDPTKDWSIATLKEAAAAFPDLVAVTPQRTYAILTKYTALADFHDKKEDFTPLDYESAGIYTRALLDHYMDYKVMWKQISTATYDLKGGLATIEMARPSEETYELATIKSLPASQVDAKTFGLKNKKTDEPGTKALPEAKEANRDAANAQLLITQQGNHVNDKQDEHELESIQFPVFSPTFAGLIHARKVCRFEMAKIVNEVDLVAKTPKLSTDTDRDAFFLNPLIFEQLLTIVRSLSPESAKLRVKDPNAAVLLGYVPPVEEPDALPPVFSLESPIEQHDLRLQASIQRCSWKAQDYLLQGCAGLHSEKSIHSQAKLTNDLETLDATFRPRRVAVWSKNQVVHGIRLDYSKNTQKPHGTCSGDPSHIWDLALDGSEIIVEVVVREAIDNKNQRVIGSITLVTSKCNIFDSAVEQPKTAEQPKTEDSITPPVGETKVNTAVIETYTWTRPSNGQYSLRGFFTFAYNGGGTEAPAVLCTLGVVWAKDTFVPMPKASLSVPICKNFMGLSETLQDNIRKYKTLDSFAGYAEQFQMGTSAAAGTPAATLTASNTDDGKTKYFNALDIIDFDWTIKHVAFTSAEGGKLAGLRVTYANGRVLDHGNFDKQTWGCDVRSDLLVVKITAGRAAKNGPSYVDTVEFIRGDGEGLAMAAWPLNVSTLRYMGEGDVRAAHDVCEVVEQAPKPGGNANWTIRGFYGEHREGLISRLGVIWGRG